MFEAYKIDLGNYFYKNNPKLQDFIQKYQISDEKAIKLLTPVLMDSNSIQDFRIFSKKIMDKEGLNLVFPSMRAAFFVKYHSFGLLYTSQLLLEEDLSYIAHMYKTRLDTKNLISVFERRPKLKKALDNQVKFKASNIENALFEVIKILDTSKKLVYSWKVEEIFPIKKYKI